METSRNTLDEKNTSKKGISLSDTVRRYSEAFALTIGLIAGVQTGPVIADNLLSDSTIAVSSQNKASSLTGGNQTISYEDILYVFMEQDVGLIETLKEKLKNEKVANPEEQIKTFKKGEKEILSFFENSLSKGGVNLALLLNKKNVSTILDLFPHIEGLFKARYGEQYMDILNKETVASSKYNLIINVKDGENGNFKIENMYLSENKKD